MKFDVKSNQRQVEHIYVHVDGSAVAGGTATTDGLLQGKNQVTITENSAGNYTLNLRTPGVRLLNVQVTPITDVTTCRVIAAGTDESAVQIEQVGADQTTPEADADFYALLVISRVADNT